MNNPADINQVSFEPIPPTQARGGGQSAHPTCSNALVEDLFDDE